MNGEMQDNLNPNENETPETPAATAPAVTLPTVPEKRFDPLTGEPLKKVKPSFPLTKKDGIFLGIAVLFCIVASALTFWGGLKSGFTISYVIGFALLTAYMYRGTLKPFGVVCGVLALLGAGVFTYSYNGLVLFFLMVVIIGLSAVYFASLRGYEETKSDFGLFPHFFKSTFGLTFGGLPTAWRSVFKKSEKKSGIGKALIGLVVSIPVVIIVVALLANADEAFAALLEKIGEEIGKYIWQIVVGLIFTPLLVSYMLNHVKKDHTSKEPREIKGLGNAYVAAFLGAICVAYLLYLFSQLAYFINGFAGILPNGVTYSDYARRGFFEICVIAGINFIVLFLVILFARKKDKKPGVVVQAEGTFIGIFTIFLSATAIAKMVMYMQTYGLTLFRISTTAFMIFMAVTFVAIIARLFVNKVPVLRVMLVAAAVVLIGLGYGNVDKMITSHNMALYKAGVTDDPDIYMVEEMGNSGVDYLIEMAKNARDESDRERADSGLYYIFIMNYDVQFEDEKAEDEYYKGNETAPGVYFTRVSDEPGDYNYEYTTGRNHVRDYMVETRHYDVRE